jgi:aminopeptidase N
VLFNSLCYAALDRQQVSRFRSDMVMRASSSRPSIRILPWLLAAGLVAPGPLRAQAPPGHHLPGGTDRPVRDREIDITDVKADLRFDMDQRSVAGTLTITFTPLRTGLRTFSLDAAELTIDRVEAVQPPGSATGDLEGRKLRVTLPAPVDPGDVASVRISYSCRPRTGMFFVPAVGSEGAEAWNYGEGGLHDAWLPLFNDTNDRFTATFDVTVARPYVALSNGRLESTRENAADGTRTFRWVQDQPIPNYLLTVDVGVFSSVPIGEARMAGSTVPLAAWGPAGRGPALSYTFGDTPKMVEFYSGQLDYPYPWAKYDQVVLREFAAGAMETTTMVGFTGGHLHLAGDPPDTAPNPGAAYPIWTSEDTISHELAHHWFGDLLTCRSLGSIWLNESFATFLHTVWNGHAHGEDDLTYQRWRYLNAYLDYVRGTGTVRPLEYLKYAAPGDMYQTETTYLKGALVLHMLRHMVGDEDFYRTLAEYLRRHAFGNVESTDLLQAFRDTTGRNLAWFFDDWIVVGGGHPAFDVSYTWDPARKQVDLTVRQVQADLPFENDFSLPVDVEVVTGSGASTHTIQVSGWSTLVSLPADARPSAVIFDRGGWIVADVRFPRSLDELLRVLATGGLAERLRAARQLATDYPTIPEGVTALAGVLGDATAH